MDRYVYVLAAAVVWAGSTSLAGCKDPGDHSAAPAASTPSPTAGPTSGPPSSPGETAPDNKSAGTPSDQNKSADTGPTTDGLGPGTDEQRALMMRAKKAFLTNKTTRAEALFETLVDTGPISGPRVSAAIALAQIYNESGRSDKAVALYDELTAKVDDVPEVQLVAARAYAKQGETSRAIDAYQTLLKDQPDYVFALVELAKLYGQAGRKSKSTKTLYRYEKKVYSLAQTLESATTPVAERVRILDVFSLVRDDRATEATVAAMGAKSADVRQKAAIVLGETGALEARKVLDKAATADPSRDVRLAAKDALNRLDKFDGDAADTSAIGPKMVDDADELPQ